jgi:hypothetical protein
MVLVSSSVFTSSFHKVTLSFESWTPSFTYSWPVRAADVPERLAERETLLYCLRSESNRTVWDSCGNPIISKRKNT